MDDQCSEPPLAEKKQGRQSSRKVQGDESNVNPYELIDCLCAITSLQADIIRKQQSVISQNGILLIDKTLDFELSEATQKLDDIENHLRKI